VIPGTGSLTHLRENLAAQQLNIPEQQLAELNAIGVVRLGNDPGAA